VPAAALNGSQANVLTPRRGAWFGCGFDPVRSSVISDGVTMGSGRERAKRDAGPRVRCVPDTLIATTQNGPRRNGRTDNRRKC
jgi:hypothetical protein